MMPNVWTMFIEVRDLFSETCWHWWGTFEERKSKESRLKASKGFNIGLLRKLKPKTIRAFKKGNAKDFTAMRMKYRRFKID